MVGRELAHQRGDVGGGVAVRRRTAAGAAVGGQPDAGLARRGGGVVGHPAAPVPGGRGLLRGRPACRGADSGAESSCCRRAGASGCGRLSGLGRLGLGGRLRARTAAATAGPTDDREVGADRHRVVLLDEDRGQRAGHGGGDLGVDLVGRDLEEGLVDGDLVALLLQPPGDGALGHGLAEGRHLHGGAVAGPDRASPDAVGAGCGGRLLLLLGLGLRRSACGLRLGRLLATLVAGLRDGVAVGLVGHLVARTGALVGLLATGVATGRGRAVTDDREVGADRNRVVLLDEDLLQRAGHRRGDLGVDLVGRHLEQRLVDLDAVTDTLEPARHGPFGDGLAERRHLHAF